MSFEMDIEALIEETANEVEAKISKEDGHGTSSHDAKDSVSANGSARGRNRSNSRRRSRSPRRRSPGRAGYRTREPTSDSDSIRERGGDHWAPGDRTRARSRSADRRYRPRDDDGGHRGRGGRDRGRDRERDRRSSPRRARDQDRENERRSSPDLNEDERDKRTVFVEQLAARLRTREMTKFFEKAGDIKECQIVKDRVSNRSKGVGYVEYRSIESLPKAIALTGQRLLGLPVIVSAIEASRNRQGRTADANGGGTGVPHHRLYVGNVHFSITEKDIEDIFRPFGELEFVQLQMDDTGRSRGYGFVQFSDPTQAKQALDKMNGFDLAGRKIRVGLGNDRFNENSSQTLRQRYETSNPNQGSSFSGYGGRGQHAGGTGGNFDRGGGRDNDRAAGGASALDDSDVGGINYKNFSRENLMKKLSRKGDDPDTTSVRAAAPNPAVLGSVQASRCVCVKNAFNAEEELENMGPTWKESLESDMREEFNRAYGKVLHLEADPNSDGDIYVKFEDMKGSEKAMNGLQGRFFGGKTLTAQYIADAFFRTVCSSSKY
ncbi:splicing factor, CC1-like protein [Aulographum hederae CBS 113979]|uniref:Splicing factor, CC1-like protein n=1 Tax=Aulographum hederae CBS 113979 TaxID=1176131 RepID=A0A6G1GZC2_9PEZI|nr:splicing factor, CC1-like protein [Aulographum hederae CBS 113979]